MFKATYNKKHKINVPPPSLNDKFEGYKYVPSKRNTDLKKDNEGVLEGINKGK